MTDCLCLRELTGDERDSAAFWRLLWFATEVGPDTLRRIHETELPELELIGSIDGAVTGFVAFRPGSIRIIIEYIAVAENQRGQGLGRHLLAAVREKYPVLSLYAQTDDDAVGFYQALGFVVSPRPHDPRWPDRQRYDCTLDNSMSHLVR